MNFLRRIGFIILCTIVGVFIVSAPATASFNGLFVKWEVLGTPPERVVEIINLDYFKSNSGNTYHLYYNATCRQGCWEKVETVPSESGYHVLPIEACDAFPFLPFTNDFVQSKKACVRWGAGTDMMAQAIDQDGIIYSWDHRLTELTFLSPLLSAIGGAVLGFIVGLSLTMIQSTKQRDKIIKDAVEK